MAPNKVPLKAAIKGLCLEDQYSATQLITHV